MLPPPSARLKHHCDNTSASWPPRPARPQAVCRRDAARPAGLGVDEVTGACKSRPVWQAPPCGTYTQQEARSCNWGGKKENNNNTTIKPDDVRWHRLWAPGPLGPQGGAPRPRRRSMRTWTRWAPRTGAAPGAGGSALANASRSMSASASSRCPPARDLGGRLRLGTWTGCASGGRQRTPISNMGRF